MTLTINFSLDEFTHSGTAQRYGIENEPDKDEIENLRRLCVSVLQPLREKYGKPLYINSGYRCPELNKIVGGVATSQHVYGEAADVRCDNSRKLLATLLNFGLDFDQAILYPDFLHISYREGMNRKQILYAKGVQP
ncbi:MAG: D-Ala-D-Ala carboxypeptidase family metallohydrolase [Tannerellaceae bacterium]|nr:D-Ala-D-Ala carboxypeptidase family metallohydrolase [Tannerellaceae bacterium]